MCRLQQATGNPVPLQSLLLEKHDSEFEHWDLAANTSGHSPQSRNTDDKRNFKYVQLHARVFSAAGLQYPPALSRDHLQLQAKCGLSRREIEIIHYFDRTYPMGMVTDPELFLDLSQNIDRQSLHLRVVPCITPGGRVWKRRDASWLLAPEAIMAQGFDPHRVPHLKTFTHRQANVDVFQRVCKHVCVSVVLLSQPMCALARSLESGSLVY